MKRSLSFLLMIALIVLCVPAFTVASTAATLPSSATLVGTQFLPPVSNQGGIGCCASEAITYLQFSNAVARYKYSLDPTTSWKPSTGSAAYCMFPGFTYNLAGAGTAWVYEVLKEQGVFPQTVQTFSGGVTGAASDSPASARTWSASEGNWDLAQQYRIKNYDQVWIGNAPYNYNITTSTAGRQLIDRIKQSLVDGNVVVTGGYVSVWTNEIVTIKDTGTLGKKYESVIPFSSGERSGGHQVAIVGYDDNITCVKNGVELKGAFLVQNSWGEGWYNGGRIWMMYDALNEVSEYSALNTNDRSWTMDQLGFLDWKTDLDIGTPELMAKINITAANRDGFSVTLTRTDRVKGTTEEYTPYIMSHMGQRIDYNSGLNFGGTKTGSQTGVLTFNYNNLLETMEKGKNADDYIWGVKVSSVNGGSAQVSTVRLVKNGSTVYTLAGLTDSVTPTVSASYSLDTSRLIGVNVPNGVTVTPTSGSYVSEIGENFSFSLSVAAGFEKTAAFTVKANNKLLFLEDGVYTFPITEKGNNTITVSGVIPSIVPAGSMGTYGSGGFENYGGELIFMPTIDNNKIPDCYSGLYNGNFSGFTFRLTVDGVTYEVVPDSNYNFGSWSLYRLPVAKCGWIPTNGQSYSVTIEICYNGIPFVKSSSVAATCNCSPEKTYRTHTHSFTSGEYIVIEGSTCKTHGIGYEYCSVDGCCAIKQVELPLDSGVHTFGNKTLLHGATMNAQGEKGYICKHCGYTVVTETFKAKKCDATGDDKITVEDVTAVLDLLAKKTDSIACEADFTGDGITSIKDVTYLLLVLEGKIKL